MISISGVRKRFGDHEALAGVDLEVPQGTVQGLLGPNGAGKTTTVRVLTTLLDPDEGEAHVAGGQVAVHGAQVHRDDLEALAFDPGDDLADELARDAVGLDQDESSFSHGQRVSTRWPAPSPGRALPSRSSVSRKFSVTGRYRRRYRV